MRGLAGTILHDRTGELLRGSARESPAPQITLSLRIVMLLFVLVLCIISSTSAGDIRCVAVSKTIGLRFNRYPLWEPKVGNKIGKLNVGTEVELLDSAQCGEGLVGVRALSGALKGESGCITGDALSSTPPTNDEIVQGDSGPDYVREK